MGAMVTFEPRKKDNPFRSIKVDAGFFNGQGLTGQEDYDSYKDFISRISLKRYALSDRLTVSGGLSFFEGGLANNSAFFYRQHGKEFIADSSANNRGAKLPRKYRGLDAQLGIKNPFGLTQLRGEYWWGTQSSSATESATPGVLLNEPYYIRRFNGAFFYLLQNLFSEKHQFMMKYDFYDPNTMIAATEIGSLINTHNADIKYNTLGVGYTYYFNKHIKILVWYDMIRNEITSLDGYTDDLKDDVLTLRMQFRF